MQADTLKAAVVALEAMEAVNGRLAKEELLVSNRDNEALRALIKMAMGGDVYNITLKEDVVSAPTVIDLEASYNEFVGLAEALNTRKLSGNEAQAKIRYFLSTCHPRMRKWYIRTLNKDLRIGVGKSIIESVFGAAFWHGKEEDDRGWFYHGCMCAKAFSKVYTEKNPISFPLGAEPKVDGERAQLFTFPDSGKVCVYMRSGKTKPEIEGVPEYLAQAISFSVKLATAAGLPPTEPLYMDGEFLASDFNSTSSVVSRTKNFSAKDFLAKIRTVLWDWAPLSAYKAGKFELPWKRRKALLMLAAGLSKPTPKFTKVSDNIYVMGHVILSDEASMYELYEKSLDSNLEGLMLKQLEAPHVFHRKHDYIVKLKPADPMTGVIVGALPGDGGNAAAPDENTVTVRAELSKHGTVKDDGAFLSVVVASPSKAAELAEQLRDVVHDSVDRRLSVVGSEVSFRHAARLGRLVVEADGEQFKIGTGFSHDQRTDFWRRRAELIGMKVDFIAQVTKTATVVARHNRFKRLREDL